MTLHILSDIDSESEPAEGMFLLHAEVVAAMRNEHVELLEAAFVEQHLDAFAGRVFASFVLFVDRFLSAAEPGGLAVFDQLIDFILNLAHGFGLFVLVFAEFRQNALRRFGMQESDGHAFGALARSCVDQTDSPGFGIGQLLLDVFAG